MSEPIILNPYSRSLDIDKSLLLVVAMDLCKKWYPLAKKFGSYSDLESFQDIVLSRLLKVSNIHFSKLEGYVKHLAKKNLSQPSELLVEDFELYDSELDFSPSTVKLNKGVESFWFNWLDYLKHKPLKPLSSEVELVYLLKSILILRIMVSKGLTEKTSLVDGFKVNYRTWWSQFQVSLVGRVGLTLEEVQARVSTWLGYFLQYEEQLIELSIMYLKIENHLVDRFVCYQKKPTKTRFKDKSFKVVGSNTYTIYKIDTTSYIDKLFDYYFEESVSSGFRLALGNQNFYNIPYLGFVLGGDLESAILETLASWLVSNFDCRFIGVVGSDMYLEFKNDSGNFPVFLVYFKEIFQFEAISCGKNVNIEK